MFSKYTVETEENRQVQQDLEIYNQLHLSDKTVETKVSCQNQFYQPPRIRQENRDKINIPPKRERGDNECRVFSDRG